MPGNHLLEASDGPEAVKETARSWGATEWESPPLTIDLTQRGVEGLDEYVDVSRAGD